MLRFEPDPSLADWFARRDEAWGELVTMGPAGFGFYARVRYLEEDRICQRALFACLRVHLAGRTKTPGDCFHALWAGAVSGMHGDPARGIPAWFPASVLTGPKVRVPNREYMLFRGHLDEVGQWGATDPTTGSSRDGELPAPHLLWPADHRWFVATDVDSDSPGWAGPGAHRRGHHRSEARRRARSPQLNARDRVNGGRHDSIMPESSSRTEHGTRAAITYSTSADPAVPPRAGGLMAG